MSLNRKEESVNKKQMVLKKTGLQVHLIRIGMNSVPFALNNYFYIVNVQYTPN